MVWWLCTQVCAPRPTCAQEMWEGLQLLLVQSPRTHNNQLIAGTNGGGRREPQHNNRPRRGAITSSAHQNQWGDLVQFGATSHQTTSHMQRPTVGSDRIERESKELIGGTESKRPHKHNNQPNISDCIDCKLCCCLFVIDDNSKTNQYLVLKLYNIVYYLLN